MKAALGKNNREHVASYPSHRTAAAGTAGGRRARALSDPTGCSSVLATALFVLLAFVERSVAWLPSHGRSHRHLRIVRSTGTFQCRGTTASVYAKRRLEYDCNHDRYDDDDDSDSADGSGSAAGRHASEADDDEINAHTDATGSTIGQPQLQKQPWQPSQQRVTVSAVSVSPDGFHVFLEAEQGFVPVKITSDPRDSFAATSAEALTIIQLLSGVDMAGAILPPDSLARMVVLHCETLPPASSLKTTVLDQVEDSLPADETKYSQVHPWFQNKAKLPTVTMDQLVLSIRSSSEGDDSATCISASETGGLRVAPLFECAVPDMREVLSFRPAEEELKHICYQYDPDASLSFVSVALALRYKAPIILKDERDNTPELQTVPSASPNHGEIGRPSMTSLFKSEEWVRKKFPQMTTASNLQKQATRVTETIERGFEVHKLTGALKIAMERNDEKAAAAIRAKLDEYDRMDDLPTTDTKNLTGRDGSTCAGGGISDEDECGDANILQ